MSQSILLRGARQVLTLRGTPCVRRGADFGNLEIIEDGSVLIQDGKITSVGPTRRLENLKEARSAFEIPVANCVVMPGFVDPSIHLSLAAPGSHGVKKRRKLVDFYNESVTVLRSCLLHGTLHAGIKASSGVHSLAADLSVLRELGRVGNSPIGVSRIWHPSTQYDKLPNARTLGDALNTVAKQKLADSIELKCNPAKPVSGPVMSAFNKTGVPLGLDWLGGPAADLQFALDHAKPARVSCLRDLSNEESDVLSQADAIAVFKAGGTLLQQPPHEAICQLVDAGGAVALGSGYDAVSEFSSNMQLVLAVAVMRLRLSIEQAIVATTINAAYAMNCGDKLGSLEPGKRAEVLVLNLSDYREIPRRLGVNLVAMAIHEGALVINRSPWKPQGGLLRPEKAGAA